MFLRMREARRFWGLEGLSGYPVSDAMIANWRERLADLQQAPITTVTRTRAQNLLDDMSPHMPFDGGDVLVRTVSALIARPVRPDGEPTTGANLEAEEWNRQVRAGRARDALSAQISQQAAKFITVISQSRSAADVERAWNNAQSYFASLTTSTVAPDKAVVNQEVARVRAAKDQRMALFQGITSVAAPRSVVAQSGPITAAVNAIKVGKVSPGGGPIPSDVRDQALIDLANGRSVDLSIGSGGVQRDYSGGGVSTGTAVAIGLAGLFALGMVALAFRPR